MKANLGETSEPMGNAFEIKKVLPNMIFNSIEVLPPEGGKIIIKTGMRKDHVQISVIDNGLGMSEEVKEKVFEPSFTTKRDKRSGLGLGVACGIIARHNGEITVKSQPGEDTTFTLKLPANQEKLERVEAS